MKALYELKEKFEMELEELARKGELGAGDLELAHKLTDTIKNIDKICALEEDGGYSGTYSRDGNWMARGGYDNGSSYARRRRDSMGRYSRDGRMYSRNDAKEAMMEDAQEMMGKATTDRQRDAIRRLMDELGRD